MFLVIYHTLKYIHTEKVINSYNEVHTYSIVITLHACGLWNMPPYRPSVGSYSCISGYETLRSRVCHKAIWDYA